MNPHIFYFDAERVKKLVEEYVRRLDELVKKRDEELCTASDDFDEIKIRDKYLRLSMDVWNEYEEKLRGDLDEIHLEFIDDYTVKIGVKYVDTRVYEYYYSLKSRDIFFEDYPLIDEEKTPLTWKLLKKFDIIRVRPIWMPKIRQFIFEIAEAEHQGRPKEAIERVKQRLRSGTWIYEYANLLRAIEEVEADE